MTEKYITYISNDIHFNDIGTELFKLAISLSLAFNLKKQFALINNSYTDIINTFIKFLKFKIITQDDFNSLNFKEYIINNFNNNDNILITFNDNENFSYKFISQEVRNILSILIVQNHIFSTNIHNKLNYIMNYFNEYNINNFVAINIKKNIFVPFYYEKSYYKHFFNKKLIVFCDDIEWIQLNLNFISKNNLIFFEINNDNKFFNFILLSHFTNLIIDKNNYSWWAAFLGNKNKTVITPNNNYDYYPDFWIKQF